MNPTPTDSGFDLMPTPYNPDNLTPEQYGADDGWRLLDEDEVGFQNKLWKLGVIQATQPDALGYWHSGPWECTALEWTYRTNLTRAELREARDIPEQPVSDTPTKDFDWCEQCGFPMMLCGHPNLSEEPSLDCKVCILLENLAAAQRERDEANQANESKSSLLLNISDTLRVRGFTGTHLDERVIEMAQALDEAQCENAELRERNVFLEQFTPKTNLALCAELLEAKARAEAAEATVTKLRQALESIASVSESDMDSATFDLWSTAINALK